MDYLASHIEYKQKIASHINNLIRLKAPLNSYGFVSNSTVTAPPDAVFLLLNVQGGERAPPAVSFCYQSHKATPDVIRVKIKILFECQEVWVRVDSDSIDLL